MNQLRPATHDNAIQLENAIAKLRAALNLAKGADCPRTSMAIRKALKSAEGARRHMYRRVGSSK